jgi:hypothetical protein
MRTVVRWLVAGWLLAALGVLGIDGHLPDFVAWTVPISLLALALAALVRQQHAPSILDRSPMPQQRYRVADDLRRPLAEVVAVAEQEATAGLRQAPDD